MDAQVILYLISSFFFLSVVAYSSWLYSLKSASINYITFWLATYIVFFYVGAVLVLLGVADGSYFLMPFKNDFALKMLGGWAILYAGVISFFSFFCFFYFLGGGIGKFKSFCLRSSLSKKSDRFEINVLFVICIFSFLYYQISIYPSPLVMAFQNYSPLEMAIRRIDVTRHLNELANTYVISILKISIYIVSYAYVAIFSAEKKYIGRLCLSVILAVFTLLSTGEKGPVVFYLLGLSISYYSARGRFLSISLKLILLLVGFVFAIYFIFMSSDVNQVISLIFDRILIAQSTAVYLSLKFYSMSGDIGFSSINNILFKLFDFEPVAKPAAEELMASFFPEMLANGGWNINGLFIGESWANFGLIGFILSPFIVGLENALVLSVICSSRKSPLFTSFYSYATVNCAAFMTSFNFYLYNSDWIVFFVIFIVVFFSRFFRLLLSTLGQRLIQ